MEREREISWHSSCCRLTRRGADADAKAQTEDAGSRVKSCEGMSVIELGSWCRKGGEMQAQRQRKERASDSFLCFKTTEGEEDRRHKMTVLFTVCLQHLSLSLAPIASVEGQA